MNGNAHRLNNDTTFCGASTGSTDPEISLVR
jgi:hypothetical protein